MEEIRVEDLEHGRRSIDAFIQKALYAPLDASLTTLEDECLELFREETGMYKKLVKYASKVIVRSLYKIQHRSSLHHLCHFLKHCLFVEHAFVAQMIEEIADNAAKISNTYASARTSLLRLSGVVVERWFHEKKDDVEVLSSLLESQALVLSRTSNDPNKLRQINEKEIFRCLHKIPTAKSTFLKLARSVEAKDLNFPLVKIMLRFLSDNGEDVKEAFLSTFVSVAFESKSRPCKEELAIFSLLMAQLDSVTFSETIKPVLSKMLKKSPDTVLEAVNEFVCHSKLDFGGFVEDLFLPVIVSKLKSQSEDVRNSCILLFSNLMPRISDKNVYETMVNGLKGLLEGKHGILSQFYQREAIFLCFVEAARCKESIGSLAAKEVGALVVDVLVHAIVKEAHENTRNLALYALGVWLQLLGHLTEAVIQLFKKGFMTLSSNSPNSSCMLAMQLAANCNEESVLKSLSLFAEQLVALVKDAQKKPSLTQLDGVLAIDTLLSCASYDISILELLQKEGILNLLDSEECFYHVTSDNLALVTRERDAMSAALTIEQCVLGALADAITKNIKLQKESKTHCLSNIQGQTLVNLASHRDITVRKACLKKLSDLVTALPDLAPSLLKALEAIVHRTTPKVAVESTSVPNATIFFNVLSTILSSKPRQAMHHLLIPTTLRLCHHPIVSGSCDPTKAYRKWIQLASCFIHDSNSTDAGLEVAMDSLFEDTIISSAVCKAFLSPSGGIFDESSNERLSAYLATSTLLRFRGNGVGEAVIVEQFFPQLSQTLSSEDIFAITEEDVAVYFTPPGVLYTKGSTTTDAKTGVAIINKGRATKDELWEHQVRQEVLNKKKGSGLSKEEQEILAAQTLKRAHVGAVVQRVEYACQAIASLTHTNPMEMHAAIPILFASLTSLLSSPLMGGVSSDTLSALTRCVCHRLKKDAFVLSSACRWAVVDPQGFLNHTSLVNKVLGILKQAILGDYGEPLPPPSLHVVFPILKLILTSSRLLDFCSDALPVLAAHCEMIAEEEEMEVGDQAAQRKLRQAMIEILLYVLDVAPKAEPEPGFLLAKVVRGPALSIAEWTPILGEGGFLSSEANVRGACIKALLLSMPSDVVVDPPTTLSSNPLIVSRLWYMCFDAQEETVVDAQQVWQNASCKLLPTFGGPLMVLISHSKPHVRVCAANALAEAMKLFPESASSIVSNLLTKYEVSLAEVKATQVSGIPSVVRRTGGRELEEDEKTFLPRCGVATALGILAKRKALKEEEVESVLPFLVKTGLSDRHLGVREAMMEAGVAMVDVYGACMTARMLAILDGALESPLTLEHPRSVQVVEAEDHQREGVVVFLGCLARHMDKSDVKVAAIVHSLLESLKIPAESVQRAVANCLAPLVACVREECSSIVDNLLQQTIHGEKYGDRIGAAFGLSAVVKGLGISALKQHSIVSRLEDAMQTGKSEARQGALFVFECLSERLGFLFEPYVIVILPLLLKSFSDTNNHVRDAAQTTARMIMGKLSAHGVKLVLPSLLKALQDNAWRTKEASIQMLGAMAYCAPRQLGSCLPQIIPKLSNAIGDSHPKVREAGKKALQDIASVVRNPEIAKLCPILLAALSDPNHQTAMALQTLQSTQFVHAIDAPSLALVTPIIHRGLKDTVAVSKKTSALIVGNMCSMVSDPRDLIPYLDNLVPCLREILVDPIPEVRAVVAKSLGMLVRGMGEEHFPDLVSRLIESLKSDGGSSVERSGCAQGLCEILVGLGPEKLDSVLEGLLPLSLHPKYSIREGVLWMVAFLPPALGTGFGVYIARTLPVIVAGLSDEAESVRDVAMRAGQVLVKAHGKSNIQEILPALEAGLFDENWRIRQSSVSLLGDLLYQIGGTRAVGVVDADDDAGEGDAAADRAITLALGKEKRNAILAALYIIRSDTSTVVRQGALQVWKSIVVNTPKTLLEILEGLMNIVVQALACDNADKRTVAGRSLGEIVRKLGDRVMPEIIPLLRAGLKPDQDRAMRQGICLGLSKVISSASKTQIEEYVDTLVRAVLDALCDDVATVRRAAAQAFAMLHKTLGGRSVDAIIPPLLKAIESPLEEVSRRALLGLQVILSIRSREILQYLIPRVVSSPITTGKAKTLGAVASVSGASIHFHIDAILKTLLPEWVRSLQEGGEQEAALQDALRAALEQVAVSVTDAGVQWFASDVVKYCDHDNAGIRSVSCWLIGVFCNGVEADYSLVLPLFLKNLVLRLNDDDDGVLKEALEALRSISSKCKPEDLMQHIDFIRNTLNSMVSDARHRKGGVGSGEFILPAFRLPKCLDVFLPVYQHALMHGSPDMREIAASGLGELVLLTDSKVLRPFLIKITGPLIRIAGDRFPGQVKVAILNTIILLLEKGDVALKPFLPQLQTTFVKALSDSALVVRTKGSEGLSKLVTLSTRIDSLVSELCEKVRSHTGGIQESNMNALVAVLDKVGANVSTDMIKEVYDLFVTSFNVDDDSARSMAGLGAAKMFMLLSNEAKKEKFESLLMEDGDSSEWRLQHGKSLLLRGILKADPTWATTMYHDQISSRLLLMATDENALVRTGAMSCLAYFITQDSAEKHFEQLLPCVGSVVTDTNKEVARVAAKVLKKIGKSKPQAIRKYLKILIPPVFNLIKSLNIATKMAAERALLYCLEIRTRPETLTEFCRGIDADMAKQLNEYSRRVLSKLKSDSGDEGDDI